jgi:hypothetical protein
MGSDDRKGARTAREMSTPEQVAVLLEEFRALYSLVTYRMSSLDRRITMAWAGLAGLVASFIAADAIGRYVVLAGLPLALVWFLRTTVNHARSFEDVLRRIEEIERAVNGMAGVELLAFQSRHPSRLIAVGGRTGTETVHTVYMTCLTMLVGGALLLAFATDASEIPITLYSVYVVGVCVAMFRSVRMLQRYRYAKRPA